ncbi:MAG: hydrogenase-4 component G [Desulfobulbaceae bacterium]|nr:hydrogenase-4 component G [Desulfobulbaceae bacterium]
MTMKVYGILESLKTASTQHVKRIDKGQNVQVNAVKTQEVFFAEFRLEVQGKSEENIGLQNGFMDLIGKAEDSEDAVFDLSQLQYNGREITEFSQEEAAELVSEDGYFGITKTAQRLSDFVIKGGGDDLDKLKAGREGMLKGFREAEQIWGGTLPDISYKTIEVALARIDERINELGGNVVNTRV